MDSQAVIEEITRLLHHRGERMGRVRRGIITALAEADEPLTAAELLDRIGGDSHRASVYRALDALSDLGLIQETQSSASATVYQLAPIERRLVMVQCRECGDTIQIDKSALAEVKKLLATEYDFQLHPCHVALSGLCANCRG